MVVKHANEGTVVLFSATAFPTEELPKNFALQWQGTVVQAPYPLLPSTELPPYTGSTWVNGDFKTVANAIIHRHWDIFDKMPIAIDINDRDISIPMRELAWRINDGTGPAIGMIGTKQLRYPYEAERWRILPYAAKDEEAWLGTGKRLWVYIPPPRPMSPGKYSAITLDEWEKAELAFLSVQVPVEVPTTPDDLPKESETMFDCTKHPFPDMHVLILVYRRGIVTIFSTDQIDRDSVGINETVPTLWRGVLSHSTNHETEDIREGYPVLRMNEIFTMCSEMASRHIVSNIVGEPFLVDADDTEYFYSAWRLATDLNKGVGPMNECNMWFEEKFEQSETDDWIGTGTELFVYRRRWYFATYDGEAMSCSDPDASTDSDA